MACRVKFDEPSHERICGFDVMHAACDYSEYHTVITGNIWISSAEERLEARNALSSIVTHYLQKYRIPKNASILFAGLGNPATAVDSLGSLISGRITVSAGLSENLPQIRAIPVGIPAKSGFDSAALIRSLAKLAEADIIVCADALTAVSRERLQTVIQITDVGIAPGSAFSHTAETIDRETMGIPVVSVGVPMAIREDALGGTYSGRPLLVTRAESDVIADCYATVIASALNKAFFGNTL